MEEPIKTGKMKGELLEREKWDKMLDEYYDLQGWDRQTSWQKRDTLVRLGLDEVARGLAKSYRLK